MSYCRCGDDSDVYVYGSGGEGVVEIHIAHRKGGGSYSPKTYTEAIEILTRLRGQGLLVPERALVRLRRDVIESGEFTP